MQENKTRVIEIIRLDDSWETQTEKWLDSLPEEERKHELLNVERYRLQKAVKIGLVQVWTFQYIRDIKILDKSPVYPSMKTANKILNILQHYTYGFNVVKRGARQFQIINKGELPQIIQGIGYFTTRELCEAYVANEKANNPDKLYNIGVANSADIPDDPIIDNKPHRYRKPKNKDGDALAKLSAQIT